MKTNNRLVVITGASSGFGLAMAKMFAKDGYPLLLLARRMEKMEALKLPNTICKKVDVTDKEAFQKAVKEAEMLYGEVDLLVNNAGVMLLGNLGTQDPLEWKKMLDVNLIGVMNGMQIVMEGMKLRKHGTIINISSIAGIQPFPNHAAYCASKYGVRGLTQTVRMELSPFNVRVIAIEPGAVSTELLEHTTNKDIVSNYNKWKENIGAVNITAADVANTVKFAYELPQGVLLREIVITDTMQDA